MVAAAQGMGDGVLAAGYAHDDPYPSCQIYAEAEQGWWCFGCQRGGRVYDLASLLAGGTWGRELRGEAFRSARELVSAALA
jgi:hypothetical protein